MGAIRPALVQIRREERIIREQTLRKKEKKKEKRKEQRKKRVLWIFRPFGLPKEAILPNGLKKLLQLLR
jgi:hypothetical protein